MPNITDLNIFIWCKFLRHLGKVMVLIVLALTGMTYYSTFTATIQPHITSNNDPATQSGFIILLIFYTLVVRNIILIIQKQAWNTSSYSSFPHHPLFFLPSFFPGMHDAMVLFCNILIRSRPCTW
jgi:hypothetical protein